MYKKTSTISQARDLR